jgi:ribosomal protein L12E/L44/L45/RPP1/RPP2
MVDATVPEENSHRISIVPGHQLEDLLTAATVSAVEAAPAGAPHTGLAGEPMAGAIAEAEAT